jgi:DNA-binding SARP family transcriptional activator
LEFRILGPLEVVSDGRRLDLGGPKQRALLAVLLLDANRVVSADRLIEALWEDGTPGTAQKALQVYVSHLRKALGKDRLETKPPGYLLRVDKGELDLDRFRELQAGNRPADALELWSGPPLAEFGYHRFAQSVIARLEESRLACLEERIDADLAAGRHGDLVGELEALVSANPHRERLRRQLMLALYRCGRHGEALAAYQEARRALAEELGLEPSRALQELERAILLQDAALDAFTEAGPAAEAAARDRAAFVGRERELGVLTAALGDAMGGHGRIVLVEGEPGIGKTRLCDELTDDARAGGALILVGRCWEAGGAPAYWPWVQALRAYLREAGENAVRALVGEDAAELVPLLPELRRIVPGLRDPAETDPEAARFRLFDATASLLKRIAAGRPILLGFDDLHAADTPSLLLLEFLAGEIADSPIMVLAAFRNVDPSVHEPLTGTLTALGRTSLTSRVTLAGLAEGEVARLIEASQDVTPPRELVEAIYDETRGNPLFVGEVVRLLAQEGLLTGGRGDVERLGVPQGVREVIGRRLDRLSDRCRQILTLAAALGREFGLVALEHVSGQGLDELLAGLDEAMTSGVISEVPGSLGRLRFGHTLIRDTIYEELTPARRIGLHRLVGEALEVLYAPDPGPHLAELAHHFFLAAPGDPAKAVDYARRAGDHALGVRAYEEAARLYDTALEALALQGGAEPAARCALLLARGEAESRAGNTPVGKQTFLEAAEIARRAGLAGELGRAAAGYAGRIVFSRAGADRRVVPLLEEAIETLGPDDAELRARLLARLAGALRDEHSRTRRDALSREAVELARGAGPGALTYALAGRAYAITAPDTVDELLGLANELCAVATQVGDREHLILGRMIRVMARLWLGEVAAASTELTEATRLAEELGQPAQLWLVLAQRASLAVATGDLDQAERLTAKAFEIGRVAQPDAAIPHEHMQRAAVAELREGLDAVEPEIRALAADQPTRPFFRCAHAQVLARLGRLPEAKRQLDALAADDFAAVPFDQEWLCAASFLAEASVLVGDLASADVLYRLLAPWGAFNAVDPSESFRGSVWRDLGVLASALGRRDEAVAHFDRALEANERMGLRPWLARAQEEYARMLLVADRPGDQERARELLDAAGEIRRELGIVDRAASS